jgi:hypothetical protein
MHFNLCYRYVLSLPVAVAQLNFQSPQLHDQGKLQPFAQSFFAAPSTLIPSLLASLALSFMLCVTVDSAIL